MIRNIMRYKYFLCLILYFFIIEDVIAQADYYNYGLPAVEINFGNFDGMQASPEVQSVVLRHPSDANETENINVNNALSVAAPDVNYVGYNSNSQNTISKPKGFVEVGGNASHLSNNYGNWSGEYLKGEIQTSSKNRWNAEILNQNEFHDNGQYLLIGNTNQFNENWYSVIDIGGATDNIFLPKYRVDVFINRKLLGDKSLIATFGITNSEAFDNHRDTSAFIGATYYLPKLWILQGGVRINDSNPGGVYSTSEFVAVTEGEDKKHFVTLRYAFGREAYQVIGNNSAISDFASQIVSLNLRDWITDEYGFNVGSEYYHNPYYNRVGVNLGVFYEF